MSTVLTAEDINNSETLQSLKAKVGDRVIDNELVRANPNVQTLTLDDIYGSDNLRLLGAKSGDQINTETNELIRKFSNPADDLTAGQVLTQEDIDNSFRLQQLRAEAGDRVHEGKLHKMNVDNAWSQFAYGWNKAKQLVDYTAEVLNIYMPMDTGGGRLTSEYGIPEETVEEKFGEDYKELSFRERREVLARQRERELQEDLGQFFREDEDSKLATAGAVLKTIVDPYALALGGPATTPIKAAVGGGGIGLTYSSAQQLAEEGEIDPVKAATATLATATLGGVIGKGVSSLRNRADTKLLDEVQARAYEMGQEGVKAGQIFPMLIEEGFDPVRVTAALNNTGRKIKLPINSDEASKAIDESIAKDSAVSRFYSPALDRYLGILSTRIRNISGGVFGRVRRFEFDTHVKTQDTMKLTTNFLQGLGRLESGKKQEIARHLYNGKFNAARGLMPEDMAREFDDVIVPLLNKTGDDLLESGHTFTKIANYFPRLVKDVDGLRNSMGAKEMGVFDRALKAYADSRKTSVGSLSAEERAAVLDMHLRGYGQKKIGAGKPRFVKQRQMDEVAPDQMQYYASPEESFSMYIRGAINDIEKRKVFGRDVKKGDNGLVDYDASIGAYVQREVAEGNIPVERQAELEGLLKSRFIGGDQSPHKANSILRDLGYMGTIANPISAITQLGDLGTTGALKGFRNMIASLFGTKNIKLVDVGLEDAVAKELTHGDVRLTSRLLNKMMGAAGFKAVDRLGKETHMTASYKAARKLVATKAGERKFRQEWSKVYGREIDSLVDDLKTGNVSENVKFHMFNELADIQPIALSEMPEAYINSPNGRVLYMLKSFMLKQYDIVRRNIVQEWNKGNKLQAVKMAALYGGYITAANAGTQMAKDMILGREVRPEDVPDRAMWALLGVFGMNKYTAERYLQRGDVKGALVNFWLPATPLFDAAFTLGKELPKDDPNLEPALKGIPVAGPLVYNWFGGGAEKFNERLKD